MARQSIYVEVHLWARAIAPPRSCSNEAATLGMKKVPHALGTGAVGLWSQKKNKKIKRPQAHKLTSLFFLWVGGPKGHKQIVTFLQQCCNINVTLKIKIIKLDLSYGKIYDSLL